MTKFYYLNKLNEKVYFKNLSEAPKNINKLYFIVEEPIKTGGYLIDFDKIAKEEKVVLKPIKPEFSFEINSKDK